MGTDDNQSISVAERNRVIVKTSAIGIGTNLLLSATKAVIGLASNSIAILLDAVNNLSDAFSSVVTIIGAKLAGKKPDKKHPYGYGRVEYLSESLIAAVILYAGITSLVESVRKIIHPETADYSTLSLLIVAGAVVIKLLLGLYVKRTGKKVNSGSLVDSGTEALFDVVVSLSVLLSAILFIGWHVSVEAYLGVIIAVLIIRTSILMLRSTVSSILGQRIDSKLTKGIKAYVCQQFGVSGAYDLSLHDYGPDRLIGSLHIEVPDTATAAEIDQLTRLIQDGVYAEFHVTLATIGIYSVNTHDTVAADIRAKVTQMVTSRQYVMQIHGFHADTERKKISLDIVVDYAAPNRKAVFEAAIADIQQTFPDYQIKANMDAYISD